jgi:hypothetical protein
MFDAFCASSSPTWIHLVSTASDHPGPAFGESWRVGCPRVGGAAQGFNQIKDLWCEMLSKSLSLQKEMEFLMKCKLP